MNPQFKATDEALKMTYAAMEPDPLLGPEEVYNQVWDAGELCRECPHLKCWNEWHPYGDTVVPEAMMECNKENVEECPGVIEYYSTHNARRDK